jgi:predicted nuclease of predicted toxin-antitoxin system
MKFLMDQDLAPRLKRVLEGRFPGTQHVIHLRLDRSRDTVLWRYAIEHDFALMTPDDDFHQRSMLEGAPPKVVYLANAQGDASGLAIRRPEFGRFGGLHERRGSKPVDLERKGQIS